MINLVERAMNAKEHFNHITECPECHKVVETVPAEKVPDQSLRGCLSCGAVFDEFEVKQ